VDVLAAKTWESLAVSIIAVLVGVSPASMRGDTKGEV
jgi:hypothetical protein